jgi:transaldolase
MTKFVLDSGDPKEYRDIALKARESGSELWGGTTNPTLIAKQAGKKVSREDAQKLQKDLIFQILEIVPGAVSAEVYADETTTGEHMADEGREIASWHKHVVVKLPTTQEGLKARTILRREHIPVNNTLVFSQEQIFAICLHELIMQQEVGPMTDLWPPFISPFIGRLDDTGLDGCMLVEHGMKLKKTFRLNLPVSDLPIWMLAASIRNIEHLRRSIMAGSELITAPAKMYDEWFALSPEEQGRVSGQLSHSTFKPIPLWTPSDTLYNTTSIDAFDTLIAQNKLDITHELTEKGLKKFAEDWQAILL